MILLTKNQGFLQMGVMQNYIKIPLISLHDLSFINVISKTVSMQYKSFIVCCLFQWKLLASYNILNHYWLPQQPFSIGSAYIFQLEWHSIQNTVPTNQVYS